MLPDSVKYSNVRNHITIEPETVELLTMMQSKWPDNADYLNLLMNKKMREALLEIYGEILDNVSGHNFEEAMKRKRYATT